jgi:hypothetical protein
MSEDLPFPIIAPGSEPEPPQSACPDKKDKTQKPFVSAGKRAHNELTYRGVDFLLNSTIGVLFTYWTARTKSGDEYWGKPVTGFFKAALKPVLKSPAALAEGAKWGSMFTSIIVGGTAIIPIMTRLEKKENKKALVRWFDERIYGKEKVDGDPKFAQSYQCIDEEPKKNFTTGMTARLIVLAPMIMATMIPETNKVLVKTLYNPIAKSGKWLCAKARIQPQHLMTRGRMEIADGDLKSAQSFVSDWDFIHRTIGFDLGLTFIYSFAHEATYKTLAALGFKQTEDPETPAVAAANAPLAVDAPSSVMTPQIMLAKAGPSAKLRAPMAKFTDYAEPTARAEAFTAP